MNAKKTVLHCSFATLFSIVSIESENVNENLRRNKANGRTEEKLIKKEGQRRSQRTRNKKTRLEQLQNGKRDKEQADFTR